MTAKPGNITFNIRPAKVVFFVFAGPPEAFSLKWKNNMGRSEAAWVIQ